jgi:hypothetical protein
MLELTHPIISTCSDSLPDISGAWRFADATTPTADEEQIYFETIGYGWYRISIIEDPESPVEPVELELLQIDDHHYYFQFCCEESEGPLLVKVNLLSPNLMTMVYLDLDALERALKQTDLVIKKDSGKIDGFNDDLIEFLRQNESVLFTKSPDIFFRE